MNERVDLDRLADYVGGALDGTPDAAEVRRLVDTDPEWATAHDNLSAAMSSVGVDLRALGADVDPVPEAVVARLDAALRHLGSFDGAPRGAAEGAPGGPLAAARPADVAGRADVADHADMAGHGDMAGRARNGSADRTPADSSDVAGRAADGPASTSAERSGGFVRPGGDRAASGPGGTGPSGTGPGRERKRRTARWAAGLSAAAAVIAFGIGVVATFPTNTGGGAESTAAGDAAAPAAAPSPEVAAGATGGGAASSGRDYRAGSFDGLADLAPVPFAAANEQRSSRDQSGAKAADVPPAGGVLVPSELARFRSPAAVEACLDAIRRLFGGDVRVTDLARYEGRPAVVVLLDNAAEGGGRPLVVVAGTRCGEIPGDVDEIYHAPLA